MPESNNSASDSPSLDSSREELSELALLLAEVQKRYSRRKLWTYFPDEGPLRRELYSKHLEFFAAGASYRERLCLAANRIGKTEGMGGYELTLHLTGRYPEWWQGRRFDRAVRAWAAGDTGKTVRDIIQHKLLGPSGAHGTGLIPGDLLEYTTPKAGVPEAIETIWVRHLSGDKSTVALKSYDQGRDAFQGTEQDLIWLDEEPPASIYSECLIRTMTTGGLVMCTFTPLEGLSETVMMFLPDGQLPEGHEGPRFIVNATWDDAPHLSAEQKAELYLSIPAYQREARSKGIPALGSGAIYPVAEDDMTVADFPVAKHWPRVWAMDVGWNRTAVLWLAWDRDADMVYVYSEHYMGQAEPVIHAQAIKGRGAWIPGVIDPAANGRTQTDGERLKDLYEELGLELSNAENSVEAGIYSVWQRLASGRLKVFKSCRNLLAEMRLYRRDDKGKVVKQNDHACDALRYGIVSGLARAIVEAPPQDNSPPAYAGNWMR